MPDDVLPPIGFQMRQKKNTYKLKAIDVVKRKDGREATILKWVSYCYDCGDEFEVTSTTNVHKYLNRRCKKCKSPGKVT